MASSSIAVENAISQITSCVQKVITPLLNSSDPRLDTYDQLIEVLKQMPEYKQQRKRIYELELEVERKTQELLRIKDQLNEMSSEGEEVVLEVKDKLPGQNEDSVDEDSYDDNSDDKESLDNSNEPTFPSQPIKTIHLTQQNSLFGNTHEISRSVEEELQNSAALLTKESNSDSNGVGLPAENGDDEEDEEEVEEIEIDGKTYFCSSDTIYECTELGDVGDECGYFKDGEAIFNEDIVENENEDYV